MHGGHGKIGNTLEDMPWAGAKLWAKYRKELFPAVVFASVGFVSPTPGGPMGRRRTDCVGGPTEFESCRENDLAVFFPPEGSERE